MSLFESLVWIPLSFYFFAACSQNWYLWTKKTAHSLSTYGIISISIGLICFSWHCIIMDMAFAYKVMMPLQVLANMFTLHLAYKYSHTPLRRTLAQRGIFFSIFLALFIGLCAQQWPMLTGAVTGWTMFVVLIFAQAPQIVRLWAAKTGAGLSSGRLMWLVAASSIQFASTWYVPVTFQTLLTLIRSFSLNLVVFAQYLYYRDDRYRQLADNSPFYRKLRGYIQ